MIQYILGKMYLYQNTMKINYQYLINMQRCLKIRSIRIAMQKSLIFDVHILMKVKTAFFNDNFYVDIYAVLKMY